LPLYTPSLTTLFRSVLPLCHVHSGFIIKERPFWNKIALYSFFCSFKLGTARQITPFICHSTCDFVRSCLLLSSTPFTRNHSLLKDRKSTRLNSSHVK